MITILKIEQLTNEKWINLFKVHFRRGEVEGTWEFVSRNKPPLCSGKVRPDAVVICAFVKSQEERKILIIKEYRYPLGGYMYGFAAGLDDEKNPAVAAIRELKEESGLNVTKIIEISPPLISSAGLSDEAATIVVVEAEGELSKEHHEAIEEIEPMLLDYDQVCSLCDARDEFEGALISAKAWPFLLAIKHAGSI